MKVILLEDVKSLGKADDIVDVNPGYANNFLIRKKMALEATPENLNSVKMRKKTEKQRQHQEYEDALETAEKIKDIVFEIQMKCGEGGKLYGAVTGMDIADAILKAGFKVDKRNITILSHIKSIGLYDAEVKLHNKVNAKIKIKVSEKSGK